MARRKTKTTDAVEILHRRHYSGDPRRIAELEKARVSAEVVHKIYELRTKAGLPQKQLAEMVGTDFRPITLARPP